jgi:hypothetical protein
MTGEEVMTLGSQLHWHRNSKNFGPVTSGDRTEKSLAEGDTLYPIGHPTFMTLRPEASRGA